MNLTDNGQKMDVNATKTSDTDDTQTTQCTVYRRQANDLLTWPSTHSGLKFHPYPFPVVALEEETNEAEAAMAPFCNLVFSEVVVFGAEVNKCRL